MGGMMWTRWRSDLLSDSALGRICGTPAFLSPAVRRLPVRLGFSLRTTGRSGLLSEMSSGRDGSGRGRLHVFGCESEKEARDFDGEWGGGLVM
jgi:hypothetical protein